MGFTKESAVAAAKSDLARRLKINESDVKASASDADFPDASLGAGGKGEMAAQMISSGWKIDASANGKSYEYRADKYQLRLKGFEGKNHKVA